MEKNEQEKQPVKLTVTFLDGHTEEYPIFMGVVAKGVIPADKIDDRIFYMAPEEGFSVMGFSSIAATSEIVAGLINTMFKLLTNCIMGLAEEDPMGAIEILEAMGKLGSKSIEHYHKAQTIRKDIGNN